MAIPPISLYLIDWLSNQSASTLLLKHQILILIDALDEGDPPEQQVAGFKGDVMAGGNKALALVVRLLVEMLPSNVRYALWMGYTKAQAMNLIVCMA